MPDATAPLVAIVGNVKTAEGAAAAAEAIGRELAKAKYRLLVYSGDPDFLEAPVVKGYVESRAAERRSIQVRYPVHGRKPSFAQQVANGELFDWRPDTSPDWEMSFYHSLTEAHGAVFVGGGDSTMIAGIVAIGHGLALLPIATFGGCAMKLWDALRPGRDLPTGDELSVMARPGWDDDQAAECVATLTAQIARKTEIARQRRLEERRKETSITLHAITALVIFVATVLTVPVAWGWPISQLVAIWLLFLSPLFAGVAGSTIRLVFDMRQGSAPLTRQSTITTGALGLIAGGIAGLLFITAQVTTSPAATGAQIVSTEQARKLVPFGVLIGFIAGLTLDAVFRKLLTADVVELGSVEATKRTTM